MENINQSIERKPQNTAEQELSPSDYIERRERERGGAFDFHVSIPKIFKENGEADLERMNQIVELIKNELGGKIKAKHFVDVKNYNDPRTGHDPSFPGLMLTQALPNYQQSIERTAALLDLIKKQNLQDVSFEIENIMPAIKTEEDKQKDGDIDPTVAFEQMGSIVEKAPEAPTHETHYGWKGRIGEVPDYDWMRENIERVCNRPVHQIVDFGEQSPEEIYIILTELAQNLSQLIQSIELNVNEDAQKLTRELSKSLDTAKGIKDKNNLAKTIVDTLKELDNIRDNINDEQAIKLRADIDAIYAKIPRITRVATTYEDNRDAVRETANKLKASRSELNWSWAEPEQVVAVGHLKE